MPVPTEVDAMQQYLERRRALEQSKDSLAQAVVELVDLYSNNLPEKAQLQNLRTIAGATVSVEEIKIYIKYQMSRGSVFPSAFGKAVIAKLPSDIDQVRLLCGYLYRYASSKRNR